LAGSAEIVRPKLNDHYPLPGATVEYTRCPGGEGLSLHIKVPPRAWDEFERYRIFLHPATEPTDENYERLTREERYLLLREYLRIRLERDRFTFKPVTGSEGVKRFLCDLGELAAYYMAEAEIGRNFANSFEPEMIGSLNNALRHFFSYINTSLAIDQPTIFMRTLMLRTFLSIGGLARPYSLPAEFFNKYYRLEKMDRINGALSALDPRAPFAYETTLTEVCRLLTGSGLGIKVISAEVKDEGLVEKFLAGDGPVFRRRQFVAAVKNFSHDFGIEPKEQ